MNTEYISYNADILTGFEYEPYVAEEFIDNNTVNDDNERKDKLLFEDLMFEKINKLNYKSNGEIIKVGYNDNMPEKENKLIFKPNGKIIKVGYNDNMPEKEDDFKTLHAQEINTYKNDIIIRNLFCDLLLYTRKIYYTFNQCREEFSIEEKFKIKLQELNQRELFKKGIDGIYISCGGSLVERELYIDITFCGYQFPFYYFKCVLENKIKIHNGLRQKIFELL